MQEMPKILQEIAEPNSMDETKARLDSVTMRSAILRRRTNTSESVLTESFSADAE